MKIAIINGPNLNLLGKRKTEVYGSQDFESYFAELKQKFKEVELVYFQSNAEGELIDYLQQTNADGIILNAAAYTHTSVAIADAIEAIAMPVVEVHISNVYAREPFRHKSYISPQAAGIVIGWGLTGYEIALQGLILKLK